MKITIQSKAILFIFIIVLLCSVFLPAPFSAHALVIPDNAFDNTDIADDLSDLDLTKYPKVENAAPSVLYFIEYCFSDNDFKMLNYALYLYIYNPSCTPYIEHSAVNVINMGIKYDSYSEDSKPSEYKNVRLQFLDKTDGEHENLFYKFKVLDSDGAIRKNAQAASETVGKRRYDVVGIQLYEQSTALAVDYGVSTTWWFWGFSAGYGDSQESTLKSEYKKLETVELKVHNTFYRPNDNEDIVGQNGMTQDQLNSVYFAVPNRLLEEYGGLQKIRAEWWEYKTNPIVITESEELYNALNSFIGKNTNGYDKDLDYILTTKREIVAGSGELTSYRSDWGYNIDDSLLLNCSNEVSALYYLFDTFNESENKYIPLDNFKLPGEELERYVENYDKSFTNGILDVDGKRISADLFTGDIDEKRKADGYKVGYNDITIDKDEVYNILSREDTTPWWQIWGSRYEETEFASVKAIEEVTADSMKIEKKKFCDTFLVDYDDYDDLKAMYDEAVTLDPLNPDDELKTVFLFRFAQTDYFSRALEVGYWKSVTFPPSAGWVFSYDDYPAGYAQTTAFMNFDIIELTFLKDDVCTVIPAVSDPIDIYDDITVPEADKPQLPDCLKIVLAVLALLVLLVILMPILPYIVKAVVWVIMLPFKLIAAIVNAIKKSAKKKPKDTGQSPSKVQAPQPKAVYKTTKKAAGKNTPTKANKDRK